MQSIDLPDYVRGIMEQLEASGNKAYLVGGCVRDIFLARRPSDWDICTGALPEEVMKIFPEALPIGLKHGTVTVIRDKKSVEVTTFRSDGRYEGHRRPESVTFIADLDQDLARRDFTVNAMAADLSGHIFDPMGGRPDLSKKIIRCVGEPEARFSEDALRMFRALRFSAQLGFFIHKDTMAGIRKQCSLAVYIAAERIRNELGKIIMSDNPQCFNDVIYMGLLDKYLALPAGEAVADMDGISSMDSIKTLPVNEAQRWSGICAILESVKAISSAGDFLKSLRLPQRIIRPVSRGVCLALSEPPSTALEWKRALAGFGIETCLCAAAGICAVNGTEYAAAAGTLNSVYASGECVSLKELAVSGRDIAGLGISGAGVGTALQMLLDYVLVHPECNRRDCLLDLAVSKMVFDSLS